MKLKIESALLVEPMKKISELITEVQIKVTTKSIELISMDPANVCLVFFELPATSCMEFSSLGDEKIGISMSNFVTILKRAKAAEWISLESKDNAVHISLGPNRKFTTPILDLDIDKETKVPPLNFKAKISKKTADIQDALEDMKIVSESFAFIAKKDHLDIIGEGDTQSARIESTEGIEMIGDAEKVKAKYSLEYLEKMIKPSISEDIVLEFAQDYPMQITYKNPKYKLMYILAPRVEND